jgi:hypothetical protein
MSDEQWLKDLQSKESVLGSAIRQHDAQEAADEDTQAQLQLLRFAMRKEARDARPLPGWFGHAGMRVAAAVFLIAGAGLLLRAQWPSSRSDADETVMRGAHSEVIRSASVQSSAQALATQLRASGAKVSVSGNEAKTTLSVQFSGAPSQAAIQALAAFSISPPANDRLLITFIP